MILEQTHFFEFKPANNGKGLMDFALSSKILNKPEHLVFVPAMIGGLEKEDKTRLKMFILPDRVVGEIYTLTPEKGEPNLDDRNAKALNVAESFIESMIKNGFCKNSVSIRKGMSPVRKSIREILPKELQDIQVHI